jgi:hypothetical protein
VELLHLVAGPMAETKPDKYSTTLFDIAVNDGLDLVVRQDAALKFVNLYARQRLLVLEGKLENIHTEDDGCVRYGNLVPNDEGLCLHVQSWHENPTPFSHAIFDSLVGKKLRVTISTMPECMYSPTSEHQRSEEQI